MDWNGCSDLGYVPDRLTRFTNVKKYDRLARYPPDSRRFIRFPTDCIDQVTQPRRQWIGVGQRLTDKRPFWTGKIMPLVLWLIKIAILSQRSDKVKGRGSGPCKRGRNFGQRGGGTSCGKELDQLQYIRSLSDSHNPRPAPTIRNHLSMIMNFINDKVKSPDRDTAVDRFVADLRASKLMEQASVARLV